MGDFGEQRDQPIGAGEAQEVLTNAGVSADQRAEILDGLTFPVPLGALLERLRRAGIDEDDLTDSLGGSP